MFQTSFDCRTVDFFAVAEGCGVVNFDFYGEVVNLLEILGNPRLKLHIFVEFEESFADPVTNRTPTAVTFVRVGADVLHCDAVSHCAVNERFFADIGAFSAIFAATGH